MKSEAFIESIIAIFAAWQLSDVFQVAQAIDPANTFPWMELVKEWGGLALAVWLVVHHTMVTIPRLQQEAKSEREAMSKMHREELDAKRHDYMEQIAGQAELHRNEVTKLQADFIQQMKALQSTFESAIEKQSCRFQQ